MIRAKMRVTSVTFTQYNSQIAKLEAVYDLLNNKEDNTYAKATPCAEFQLTIDNPEAQGILLPGKTFYIDISPA